LVGHHLSGETPGLQSLAPKNTTAGGMIEQQNDKMYGDLITVGTPDWLKKISLLLEARNSRDT
jgi:hypothetical protein